MKCTIIQHITFIVTCAITKKQTEKDEDGKGVGYNNPRPDS